MIKNLLTKLIDKKYYTKEEIQKKCSVFYAMSVISDEEYSELMLHIEEVYIEVTENSEPESTS